MEEITNEIRLGSTDRPINDLLAWTGAPAAGAPAACPPEAAVAVAEARAAVAEDRAAVAEDRAIAAERPADFTRHFNQQEALFLKLRAEYEVPPLPVHHDVRLPRPESSYLERLRKVVEQLVRLAPGVFQELTYLFDPREILRPAFFRLYRVDGASYLYLLQADLMFRPNEHRSLEKGSNDLTYRYSTDKLFLDALLIPLERVTTADGHIRSFTVRQLISNTWIGEVGRGYFQQGIWMDNELTRFFSRLFLPAGKRVYPFFPYLCKYKTVCQSVIQLSGEERRQKIPLMHRAIQFLAPAMAQIEASMKAGTFSEDNPTFQELRGKLPPEWLEAWRGIEIEAYLNEQDMKEYRIEG